MEVFSFFKVWHSLKGVSLKASRADYILDCVSNHPSPTMFSASSNKFPE